MKALLIAEGKRSPKNIPAKQTAVSMLKIGGLPILHHQVNLLKKYQITDIHLSIHHFKEEIINYFGNGKDFGVKISYLESHDPSGNFLSIKELQKLFKEDFILFKEDVFVNMELGKLTGFHNKKGSEFTMVVHPTTQAFNNYLIELDTDERISRYFQPPHAEEYNFQNLSPAGVYILSPACLKSGADKTVLSPENFSLPGICASNHAFGYNTSEYFKEIRNKEDYVQAQHDYETGKFARMNFEYKQKAIFMDRDGVMNEETGYINKPEELRLFDSTASAIRKINASAYLSLVVTNQASIARGYIKLKELKAIHNKMETDLAKENARLDSIYFCPHHPERSLPGGQPEFQVDCLCRKPKPGMLLDAAYHFNIDLASSFIIGDSERDIKAGMSAGCTTFGVMTGYGLRNTSVVPDFLFANLAEATDFIIDEPYKEAYNKISSTQIKTPCIISVGGLARSGKSTLSSYLKRKFENNGKKVLIVHLDSWLSEGKNISQLADLINSFPLEIAETDIQQILVGISVKAISYTDFSEGEIQEMNYKYKGEEYIIIEGTSVFRSKILRDLAQIKIFLNAEPEIQKKRLIQMMEWQGKEVEDFSDIYNKIRASEIQYIEPGKKYANIII